MPAHHHCNAHAGLPRVWLGWGELGNRKAQLQARQEEYFETHTPDFKLRHPDNRQRGWDVHLDVIRKSTRWIDWRIHKTGDKQRLVLPDLICQLLRIHLSMFQTALLLRITDLQAIAFRRFRDLMDTAPAFVLHYEITGLKSVTDYRPELVLPAVLRYCGYYRMNPQQITRHGKKVRVFGEAEFAELCQKSPKFGCDLALGIWLDTIDITVPTIKFPGNSEPIRSIHPYMQMSLPPQVADRKRSNYQYVTYLQPLPFKDFNDQRPSNTPTWTPSPFTGSFATPQTSSQRTQTRTSFTRGSEAAVQHTPDFPQFALEQTDDFSFLEDGLIDTTMDHIAAQLPQEYSTGPDDLNNIDWAHTMDWSGVDIPDIDFSELMNDDSLAEPSANALDASDLTQEITVAQEDLANEDFTRLLNDDTLDLQFIESSCLDPPMDIDMELDPPELNSFDMTCLPDIDFSALTSQEFIDPAVLTQPQYMDSVFPGMDTCFNVPQEINFLPEQFNSQLNTYSTASKLRNHQPVQIAAPSTQSLVERQAIRSAAVSAQTKSRASIPCPRRESTQTRYNLRTRPSVIDLNEEL
ncbi:uncharacterized protein PGRI_094620 [Penicillium griseofulvum]|uniref:Uncharacterized protein n=1 Tax=Penicillium patulum TaxID=5078 RepID=A0A135LR62_PENPA|nr:uncharacterized protein PGRI_094620 [Penicillium griseofulvum]KXG51450.1 hypothetical protein PGRI_094620 [Penicillium griseofulvum]